MLGFHGSRSTAANTLVGVAGFEPATSWSQTRRASAALHPAHIDSMPIHTRLPNPPALARGSAVRDYGEHYWTKVGRLWDDLDGFEAIVEH